MTKKCCKLRILSRLSFFAVLVLGQACPADQGGGENGGSRLPQDDDFAGLKVDARWAVLNASTFDVRVSGGELWMTPNQNVVWYQKNQGPALVQLVSGNFRVSTRVLARKASDPQKAVDAGYQFGGIIARDPDSDSILWRESYVFTVVGFRGDYLSAETKTTKGGYSKVEGPPWSSGDAELRICRLGSAFHLYNRQLGNHDWKHAITYERPDLPETLQVGPIAYTMTDTPDLIAKFDAIRFASVASREDCIQGD